MGAGELKIDMYITHARAPHGYRHSLAPMLRVEQGSISNCSIQDLVEQKKTPHTIMVCVYSM